MSTVRPTSSRRRRLRSRSRRERGCGGESGAGDTHRYTFTLYALDRVLALLPALQRPTISSLSDPEWVAVNTIIEERTVRDLIPKLKLAGGQGIVEYPLNKIVM